MNISLISIEEDSERSERADAAANRRLVLQTAERLFAERGVDEVSMAEIASEAGVGKGTLYRRFDNKADLALTLLDSQMNIFQDSTLAELRESLVQGTAFVDQLEGFLVSLVYFTDQHLPLLCAAQRMGLLLEASEQSKPYHWQFQTVSGLMRRAIDAGEITADIDVEYSADALLATLRGDMFNFQRTGRGFSNERISSGLIDLLRALGRYQPS